SFVEADDLVAKHRLRAEARLFEQQPRKLAASERHKTPVRQLLEHTASKSGHALTAVADHAQLRGAIAEAVDLARQPHAFGDVVAEPPEVDHVAPSPQLSGVLDQGRLEPGSLEPERERRAGNTCAGDQDGRVLHRDQAAFSLLAAWTTSIS